MTKEQAVILLDEIQSVQKKLAIECLSGHLRPGFHSNQFVPKSDGGWRPTINFRKLNSSLLQGGKCLHLERDPEKRRLACQD